MGEQQPRVAQPPDFISGPLSPKNHAWLVTHMANGHPKGSSSRRHWEAIARQQGYERNEEGNFVPGVELILETEAEE